MAAGRDPSSGMEKAEKLGVPVLHVAGLLTALVEGYLHPAQQAQPRSTAAAASTDRDG